MSHTPEQTRSELFIPWEEIPGGKAIIEGKGLTRQQYCYMMLGLQMLAYYQARNADSSSSQSITDRPFYGEEFTVLLLKGLLAVDRVFDNALKAKKKEGK